MRLLDDLIVCAVTPRLEVFPFIAAEVQGVREAVEVDRAAIERERVEHRPALLDQLLDRLAHGDARTAEEEAPRVGRERADAGEARVGDVLVAAERELNQSAQRAEAITGQVVVGEVVAHQTEARALRRVSLRLHRIPGFGVRLCKRGHRSERREEPRRNATAAEVRVADGEVAQKFELFTCERVAQKFGLRGVRAVEVERAHCHAEGD